MESIIKDDIVAYMVNNNLFANSQHGFIPGRNCQSNLLSMLNLLTSSIENKTNVDLVYLDFAKAFDSVPHIRLAIKLKNYGINGNLLHWIKNFLYGRRQQVRINSTLSNWENVTSGVPQGSVIGPILFLIFINDLPRDINATIFMFADDTKLMKQISSTDCHDELQDDINHLTGWSEKWELGFNTSKCKVMHFGNDITSPYMMIDLYDQKCKVLDFVSEEKDLGIIIDNKLNFRSHISTQVKKANRMMGLIRRSFTYLDRSTFRCLFNSLVRPHLEYCVSIWYPLHKREEDMIENVLRRASKRIPGFSSKTYGERLAAIKTPSMKYRRMRGDMIIMYQIFHSDNNSLHDLFEIRTSRTRGHNFKIYKPLTQSSPRNHFFSIRAANSWNSLPYEVVNAVSLSAFKSKLDTVWSDKMYMF